MSRVWSCTRKKRHQQRPCHPSSPGQLGEDAQTESISISILGDSIRYHMKMLRTTSRELMLPRPGRRRSSNDGTMQKGWMNEASLVKYCSMVRRCSSRVPWQRDLTTARISWSVAAARQSGQQLFRKLGDCCLCLEMVYGLAHLGSPWYSTCSRRLHSVCGRRKGYQAQLWILRILQVRRGW